MRVRRKITGTGARPRLSVFRSAKHISAQLIDDATGNTIVAASSVSPAIRGEIASGGDVAAAGVVGRVLGERAAEAGVSKGILDRGGYRYHGRVQALAEAARKAGLDLGPTREPMNKGRKEAVPDKEKGAKGGGKGGKKGKKKQAE